MPNVLFLTKRQVIFKIIKITITSSNEPRRAPEALFSGASDWLSALDKLKGSPGHIFTPQWWQMRSACPHDYSSTAVRSSFTYPGTSTPDGHSLTRGDAQGYRGSQMHGAQPSFHRQTGDFTEERPLGGRG